MSGRMPPSGSRIAIIDVIASPASGRGATRAWYERLHDCRHASRNGLERLLIMREGRKLVCPPFEQHAFARRARDQRIELPGNIGNEPPHLRRSIDRDAGPRCARQRTADDVLQILSDERESGWHIDTLVPVEHCLRRGKAGALRRRRRGDPGARRGLHDRDATHECGKRESLCRAS